MNKFCKEPRILSGFASRAANLIFTASILIAGQLSSALTLHGIDSPGADSRWVLPASPSDALIWGRKDGIVFGLPSADGIPGPRGLIRVGIISPNTGKPELLNFIAIEPVVAGHGKRGDRMAFSELESSQLDGVPGKRLWVNSSEAFVQPNDLKPEATLSVPIQVERFQANGAHVYVIASIAGVHPEELRLSVFAQEDSPAIEELTLTATMGNYERLRWLWLKNRVVDSRTLYRGYRGEDFAERKEYALSRLLRTSDGDAIAFCTTNEASPAKNPDFKAADHWRYRLPRLTQYWRVPESDVQSDLRVRVNGRRVYWNSHAALGGGIAFENFEVRQRYKPGQTFIFGATPDQPWDVRPSVADLHPEKIKRLD